jgi:hypothetical protein
MKRGHEIEFRSNRGHTPHKSDSNSQPRIRRQVMRICEEVGIEFDDVAELHLYPDHVLAVLYERSEDGEFYLNEFNKPAMRQQMIPVDTTTFVGDERDI